MTDSEYATLIFYWAYEPKPERMDEMLSFLANSVSVEWIPARLAAMCGVVLALETLSPGRAPIWRLNHAALYATIERCMESLRETRFWTDFLVAQWFILRQDSIMKQLLERAGAWGEKDQYTVDRINGACAENGPFRYAAERNRLPVLVQRARQ
jgi:hypothetical protein